MIILSFGDNWIRLNVVLTWEMDPFINSQRSEIVEARFKGISNNNISSFVVEILEQF